VVLAVCALIAMPAASAWAAPYSVEIERPSEPRVHGSVQVTAHVDGLGGPSNVALELLEPGETWSEDVMVEMASAGEGRYTATLDSEALPNASYRLHVRAWGGSAGPYDPSDDGTYSEDVTEVAIANAPPAPAGLTASGGAGQATAAWEDVATASRGDFAGYEIYLALADQEGLCPAFGAVYSLRETTYSTSHTEGGLPAARYCFRVRALRSSPGTPVASKPTAPATADVSPGSGSPGSPGGSGGYGASLPYSPRTELSPIPGGSAGPEALESGSREGRFGWALMAGGLVLAVLAFLLLRYVRTAPKR
jgi:hypothetical protein